MTGDVQTTQKYIPPFARRRMEQEAARKTTDPRERRWGGGDDEKAGTHAETHLYTHTLSCIHARARMRAV